MPVQIIELGEVIMMEASDEALEATGGSSYFNYTYTADIQSCGLQTFNDNSGCGAAPTAKGCWRLLN